MVVVVAAASIFLAVRTRHGKEITVPDLTSQTVQDALSTAGAAGLRVQVVDSVYMKRMPRGAVVSHSRELSGCLHTFGLQGGDYSDALKAFFLVP